MHDYRGVRGSPLGHAAIGRRASTLAAVLLAAIGCGNHSGVGPNAESKDAAKDSGHVCTEAGVSVLYSTDGGTASQPAVANDQVIIATTSAVVVVPRSGGAPTVLSSEVTASSAVVLNGIVYFRGLEIIPNANPALPSQSVPTLYSVPLAGGSTKAIEGFGGFTPLAADDTSIYLGGNASAIRRWTPASGGSIDLPIPQGILVDDIAVAGNYVYIAAQDLAAGGLSNGLIARIPKTGGAMSRLVTNIGHPFQIEADAEGLYWAEDPPVLFGVASGRLVRSTLEGGASTTLVPQEPISLAVVNGQVLFSTGTEIDRVSTKGGKVTLIATGLINAGMLVGANDYLVWIDPTNQSFGSTVSPIVMTSCLTP